MHFNRKEKNEDQKKEEEERERERKEGEVRFDLSEERVIRTGYVEEGI